MIVTGSGNERPILAVRATARGEQTLTPGGAIAWVVERGAPYLATPLVYQGLLYICAGNGVLSVYRVETGTLVYRSRLSETPATFSASPVAANGLIYFTSDEGDVIVLRAAERFERVAVNTMNEPCLATPAIAGDALFIRTARQLFAIGSTSSQR